MLVQGEPPVDQERNIVLHCHVDRILQGVDLQDFRICIMFSAYSIVQFQQVVLILEQHDELSVIAVFVSFVMFQPPYENVVQRD